MHGLDVTLPLAAFVESVLGLYHAGSSRQLCEVDTSPVAEEKWMSSKRILMGRERTPSAFAHNSTV